MFVQSFFRKYVKYIRRRLSSAKLLARWLRDTWRMVHFVRDVHPAMVGAESKRVAAIIAPWYGSSVPWFSIAVGLLLNGRGCRVTFVLDDQRYGENALTWYLQLSAISAVLAVVRLRHLVVRLSDFHVSGEIDADTQVAINRLAYLNAVWDRKGETGIDPMVIKRAADQLQDAGQAIWALLDIHPQDLLFVPGGICASSGLWLRAGRSRGIQVSTYDSGGYGALLLAADGIACQLSDIPRAYAALREQIRATYERRIVIEFAEEEIRKRRAGNDMFSSQIKGTSGKRPEYEGGVLLTLNSSWDSAALGLHAVFETTQDWIVQTVRHVLENSEVPVLVRQHPIERLPLARSVDDTRALLRQHFGDHPRLHFISAEDQANSYDLIEQVAAVVAYTSTVGVEAVAQGRVVVTEANSYYADLGFVLKATTSQAYFSFLDDAVAGRRSVTPAMRENALYCYYITQCCNWIKTSFNVPGFSAWSRKSLADLAADSSVDMVITSVVSNIPISLLNHRRRMNSLGLDHVKEISL